MKMNDRKLASIQKVLNVEPIENSDFLDVIQIQGWKCVTKRGEFKIGDLVIYCEIDSFLPCKEEFEFLRKSSYKKVEGLGEGFRIRSTKLRGTLSQGIVFPLSILSNYTDKKEYNEDDDVTDILGIQKYEPPIPVCLRGLVKGNFPGFFPKTDAERIQNLYYKISDEYKNDEYEASLKLDGTSFSCYYKNNEFGVCSRNLDLKETDENLYWQIARKYNLRELLYSYNKELVIQGEIIGEGIQKNKENLKGQHLYVFSIFDPNEQRYYTTDERLDFIYKFELQHVPIINRFKPFELFSNINEFLNYADRPSLNSDIAEGVVFKNQRDTSYIFKAINNNFLIKYKE